MGKEASVKQGWLVIILLGLSLFVAKAAWAQSSQGVQVQQVQASVSTNQSTYNLGDLIQFSANLNTNAFVYLFQFDSSNVTQLFPNTYQQDNFLNAGTTTLPGLPAYEFVASPPTGNITTQIVASTTPLDFGTDSFIQPFPNLGTFNDFQERLFQIQSNNTIAVSFTNYFVNASALNVNNSPVASFNYLPGATFAGQIIEFDATFSFDPDGTIENYQWDFTGDGQPDASGLKTATSFTEGSFDITLFVTDDQGQISSRTKNIIVTQVANQSPTAIFTVSPSQPISGEITLFDASTSRDTDGQIVQYLWDFENDGHIDASGQRAITRFDFGGVFQVSLTVVDNLGASNTRTQLISVRGGQANLPPTASFTVNPSQPRIGELVTLDATSSRDIDGFLVDYQWDVDGDGINDFAGAIIRIRFNNAGIALIRLAVTDNQGDSASAQQTIQVQASEQPPLANFSISPTSPVAGETVIFDASSSLDPDGFITQYQWDFQGDGITDLSGRRVATRFNTAGSFRVVLTVVDNNGNTSTAQQFVQVGQSFRPPSASFTVIPTPVIVGEIVTLNASSSFDSDGTILQYEWDFQSDGQIDAFGVETRVRFNSIGATTITLNVIDNDGLSGQSQQTIQVIAPRQPPIASFTFLPSDPAPGQIVSFDGSSSNDPDGFITDYRWDFNGASFINQTGRQVSFQFIQAGTFDVTLTVTDNDGLTAMVTQTVTVRQPGIPPLARFTVSSALASVGDVVTFDASTSSDVDGVISQYQWDFETNGSIDASGVIANHAFALPRTFEVTLTVTDNDGFSASSSQMVAVRLPPLPLPIAVNSFGQPVSWLNTINVAVSGNSLTNISTSNEWENAGAISAEAIISGDGFLEFTATETNTAKIIGFANDDNSLSFDNPDFSWVFREDSHLVVFESGTNILDLGANSFSPGDVLRIEVIVTDVHYLLNGAIVHISSNVVDPSNYPLRVDAAFRTTGATLQNVQIGLLQPPPQPIPVASFGENVQWVSAVNASVNGNSLTKITNVNDWDAGAFSTQFLNGQNGFVESVASETNTRRMFGFSARNNGQSFEDLMFAWFLRENGELFVFDSGSVTREFAPNTYQSGDVLRIEVIGSDVLYLLNGNVLHISRNAVNPGFSLHIDTSLRTPGATIQSARIGLLQPAPPSPAATVVDVTWVNELGVSVAGNSLTKTGNADDWDAGAFSVETLNTNGYIESTVGETNTRRMFGFSAVDSSQNFEDLLFAWFLRENGELFVFDSGGVVKEFAPNTYQTGDTFRVQISGSNVVYLLNDHVLHISQNVISPGFSFHADTSLKTPGATLQNVRIGSF